MLPFYPPNLDFNNYNKKEGGRKAHRPCILYLRRLGVNVITHPCSTMKNLFNFDWVSLWFAFCAERVSYFIILHAFCTFLAFRAEVSNGARVRVDTSLALWAWPADVENCHDPPPSFIVYSTSITQ